MVNTDFSIFSGVWCKGAALTETSLHNAAVLFLYNLVGKLLKLTKSSGMVGQFVSTTVLASRIQLFDIVLSYCSNIAVEK